MNLQQERVLPLPDDLAQAHALTEKLRARLSRAVRGRDDVIDLVLIGLLADGHVLLEDYPGSGKTTLARALGESIEPGGVASGIAPYRRIQFTPDLLPSDVTGTSIFQPETANFVFRRGPVFSHVVLADEINRTSPKVQAAMLEAMAEKQVTADNDTYPLDSLFFVIATQNPLDMAGTYPLPRPQLDRFLFKIQMKPIAREAELAVLADYPRPRLEHAARLEGVSRGQVLAARERVRASVSIHESIREALVDCSERIREDSRVLQGVSTRALVMFLPALQARALLRGRDHVTPEDVGKLLRHVFAHRVECVPGIDDPGGVVREACRPVLEGLARGNLGP